MRVLRVSWGLDLKKALEKAMSINTQAKHGSAQHNRIFEGRPYDVLDHVREHPAAARRLTDRSLPIDDVRASGRETGPL